MDAGLGAAVGAFNVYAAAQRPFCGDPVAKPPPLCADRTVVIQGDRVAHLVADALDRAEATITALDVGESQWPTLSRLPCRGTSRRSSPKPSGADHRCHRDHRLVAELAPKVIDAGKSMADLWRSAGGTIADAEKTGKVDAEAATPLIALVDARLAALHLHAEDAWAD